ncbi:pyridoxal phosphate-dependent aminotransferase [Rubrivivax rivuli]|uniref:Aminotransferase n=1 Tax=Rubrivivax rivuli TaxID=1862385 RepID=A0A437RD50_9BURK|nr:pyridoxal phosphate-dependent aminotransferase [Rubrivivax rivuli]RVU44689.1 pyridoxal phosphate-dependent aminotransferase [Rubrivivax rivuli]
MRTASRLAQIEPFWVMECAKAADAIARSPACDPALGGEPMIYLNIGEPDFTAVPGVQRAATAAIERGRTQYTHATGLQTLRERIAGWYGSRFGVAVAPSRIVVTAGASAALQLATLALFEPGDEVLMPDPSYPCNRHFVTAAGAKPVLLPTTAAARFQLEAASVAAAWGPNTRGVLLASPSNPTGTSISASEMGAIAATVRERGGVSIVDEIYLGLSYEPAFGHSALALADALGEQIVSVNSFSKYFGMTGWRLGWMVLPPELVAPVEKLAQNLYICPSTIAQHAALACFEPEALEAFEQRREEFRRRRDFIVPALEALGLKVPVQPDGAFYVWFDCSRYSASSWDFCFELMHSAHVALTPGRDFGPAQAERYVRLSFASALPQLEAAVARLQRVLRA